MELKAFLRLEVGLTLQATMVLLPVFICFSMRQIWENCSVWKLVTGWKI
jgi:hypothetical protein